MSSSLTTLGPSLGRNLTRRTVLGGALGLGFAVAGVIAGQPGRAAAQGTSAQGTYRTTAALNLRAGAGTSYKVVSVMPAGTTVPASGRVANGFREVWYQGYLGWAHGDYLVPATGGGTNPIIIGLGVTTAAVNLRSGPSTSNRVLRVLARGTLVERSDTVRNGFRYVIHQGLAGWVFDAYLAVANDGPGPRPVPVARTTAAVNFRAQPSLSAAIVAVIPAGTQVSLQPGYSNGFREVGYNGTYGWVYAAYLN